MNVTKITVPNALMLGEVDNLLREGHSVVIMTKGCSMLPFIHGDRDSVELVRTESLKAGDIALAQVSKGRYVLHRVIAVEGNAVTLKGDGNLDSTESCTLDDVCGIVRTILRPGDRKTDCGTGWFGFISRTWRSMPRFFRRYFLAIYRRIFK